MIYANGRFFAAVGNDGRRPVVWGVGVSTRSVSPEMAQQTALAEAESDLREADCRSDLTVVEIDRARWIRITHGDVDASDLVRGGAAARS